jgi:hypothetical protein
MMDQNKTDLLHLAKIAIAQAKVTLYGAASRVIMEIGETYLKSAATAGLRLSPMPDGPSAANPPDHPSYHDRKLR